ncbi:hypothetical protein U1Q18_003229 [Sarracenia purpurea var. burkii]
MLGIKGVELTSQGSRALYQGVGIRILKVDLLLRRRGRKPGRFICIVRSGSEGNKNEGDIGAEEDVSMEGNSTSGEEEDEGAMSMEGDDSTRDAEVAVDGEEDDDPVDEGGEDEVKMSPVPVVSESGASKGFCDPQPGVGGLSRILKDSAVVQKG